MDGIGKVMGKVERKTRKRAVDSGALPKQTLKLRKPPPDLSISLNPDVRPLPEAWQGKSPDEISDLIAEAPCACNGSGYVGFFIDNGSPGYAPCSCFVARLHERRVKRLFEGAGIPAKFAELNFDTFEALPAAWRAGKGVVFQAAQWLADVENYERYGGVRMMYRLDNGETRFNIRPGLLFYGPVGTCKTGLASIVARSWLDAGRGVMWITYIHMIKHVQAGYGEQGNVSGDRISTAQRAELLVIDDLGTRRTDRQESFDRNEILYQILEKRHANDMATLITTNLEPDELEHQFDNRIASRVYDMCHFVEIESSSADIRKVQALGGEIG